MTSVVSDSIDDFLAARSMAEVTTGVGLVVVAVALFLLAEREVIRQANRGARLESFAAVLVPLVAAVGVIVLGRFAGLAQ